MSEDIAKRPPADNLGNATWKFMHQKITGRNTSGGSVKKPPPKEMRETFSLTEIVQEPRRRSLWPLPKKRSGFQVNGRGACRQVRGGAEGHQGGTVHGARRGHVVERGVAP